MCVTFHGQGRSRRRICCRTTSPRDMWSPPHTSVFRACHRRGSNSWTVIYALCNPHGVNMNTCHWPQRNPQLQCGMMLPHPLMCVCRPSHVSFWGPSFYSMPLCGFFFCCTSYDTSSHPPSGVLRWSQFLYPPPQKRLCPLQLWRIEIKMQ